MRRIAFIIALVLMLAGSAFAQRASTGAADPLWAGFPLVVTKMEGVEVSPGTIDSVDNICWGRTFLLMSETGSFTFMPNYTIEFKGEPGENYSKITGGAWTMSYKGGKKNGMIFGEFTGGEIEWQVDKAGNYEYGNIKASVIVNGGTGTFTGAGGLYSFGSFTGHINFSNGFSEVTDGYIALHF